MSTFYRSIARIILFQFENCKSWIWRSFCISIIRETRAVPQRNIFLSAITRDARIKFISRYPRSIVVSRFPQWPAIITLLPRTFNPTGFLKFRFDDRTVLSKVKTVISVSIKSFTRSLISDDRSRARRFSSELLTHLLVSLSSSSMLRFNAVLPRYSPTDTRMSHRGKKLFDQTARRRFLHFFEENSIA